MNKSRRIGALLAASAAAMGMATVGLASPAAAHYDSGPRPVSDWLRAVQANDDTWVNIAWRTDRRICDVEVRVDGGRRVDIDYPGRRDYTSFSRGDSLRPGRVDYTAFEVEPRFSRTGIAVLRATIEYDDCGFHGRTQRRSSWVNLPIVRFDRWSDHRGQGNVFDGRDHDGRDNNGRDNGWDNNGRDNGWDNGRDNDGRDHGGRDIKGHDTKGYGDKGQGTKGQGTKGHDTKGQDDNKGHDMKGDDNRPGTGTSPSTGGTSPSTGGTKPSTGGTKPSNGGYQGNHQGRPGIAPDPTTSPSPVTVS